jgi:hypothetical protein
LDVKFPTDLIIAAQGTIQGRDSDANGVDFPTPAFLMTKVQWS